MAYIFIILFLLIFILTAADIDSVTSATEIPQITTTTLTVKKNESAHLKEEADTTTSATPDIEEIKSDKTVTEKKTDDQKKQIPDEIKKTKAEETQTPDIENRQFDPKTLKQTIALSDDLSIIEFSSKKKSETELTKTESTENTEIKKTEQTVKDSTHDQTTVKSEDQLVQKETDKDVKQSDTTADLSEKKDDQIADQNQTEQNTEKKKIRKKIQKSELVFDESRIIKRSDQIDNPMILFKSQTDQTVRSKKLFSKDDSQNEPIYYHKEDFLPVNDYDFNLAKPVYRFNEQQVIVPGNLFISEDLGLRQFQKAEASLKTGQLINARTIYEKLIHYNYETSGCYYYIGIIYSLSRDYYQAIQYLEKAAQLLKQNQSDPRTLSNCYHEIALNYSQIKESSKTEEYLKLALDADRSHYKIYNALGIFYYQQKQTDLAISNWEKGAQSGNRESAVNLEWIKSVSR